jgi:hypothetical protein
MSIAVDSEYSKSMFTRLFFERKNTEKFEFFAVVPQTVAKGIVVYKIK